MLSLRSFGGDLCCYNASDDDDATMAAEISKYKPI